MHRTQIVAAAAVMLAAWACSAAEPAPVEVTQPADIVPTQRVCVVVFDFQGPGGADLADRVRLRLGRHEDCQVVDALTLRTLGQPPALQTDPRSVTEMMHRLAGQVALWGEVRSTDGSLAAIVRCVDRSKPSVERQWVNTFSSSGERASAEIARQIVETLRAKAEWTPPQSGQETEPNNFGAALNVNGDFEQGAAGWERPDGVSTFLLDGPPGRGKVLKIRTDLAREPWLDYRRKLLLGQADPSAPPQVPRDVSLKSVAATEGVHYCSDWITAEPGRRYWLTADVQCRTTSEAFPRIFVKGFADMSASADGLPQRSLAERNLTPQAFAALPEARRKELIAEDVCLHGDRYRREVYHWYLACRNERGDWTHMAAPFPPRGGLPEYLFDNVVLDADPRQQAPLPEAPARTPGARRP
jgi:hypothetical protein